MPFTIYVPKNAESSGVSITYTPSRNALSISSWYDHICGSESEEFTLSELLEELHVPISKVKAALKIMEARQLRTTAAAQNAV